jgi:hypothetical protein
MRRSLWVLGCVVALVAGGYVTLWVTAREDRITKLRRSLGME